MAIFLYHDNECVMPGSIARDSRITNFGLHQFFNPLTVTNSFSIPLDVANFFSTGAFELGFVILRGFRKLK